MTDLFTETLHIWRIIAMMTGQFVAVCAVLWALWAAFVIVGGMIADSSHEGE